MKVSKKVKKLLNSVSNGGKLEGALAKIYEEFIKDITDEVELLKSRKSEIKENFVQLFEKIESDLSDKLIKVKEITDFRENIDFTHYDNIKKNLEEILKSCYNTKEEISDNKKKLDDAIKVIDTGLTEISKAFKTKINIIENSSDKLLNEIKSKKELIDSSLNTIEDRKKDLKEQIDIWHKSIEQKFESLSKQNALYMENEGLKLFGKYIQDNAYKILWYFIMGLLGISKKN